ncbi:TRAP transporter large permease [Georgenia subflava]|uniref:TRAP transporter large permease subunit n=1 Tax=Georgenia subflava TaxID=1622177 RepID=A0A6N7EF41_9MICO|nr:TRAP transporter large permease [Georgenia subflava]MPV35568.1 TRAP transporter large permease subunit [Georgenia subflava]
MSVAVIAVVIIAVVILLAFVLFEQPIWLALGASGGIGLIMLSGTGIATDTLGSVPFTTVASYSLVIIPMFILMGIVAAKAGVAEDVFAVAEKLVGRLPGGLGIATILACGGFAAVTGSSVATVATVGRIAIKQMTRHGYRANAAGALVAAGGTLGVLIPPSVILVVYAALTGESIGRLLMGGFIPGAVTMLAYSTATVILYKRGFFAEPALARTNEKALVGAGAPTTGTAGGTATGGSDDGGPRIPARQPVTKRNMIGAVYTAGLMIIVMGGMYSGLFTATESGAVAAFIAVVMLFIRYRDRWRELPGAFKESLFDTTSLNSMIFALLIGGGVFAYFLVRTGLPSEMARAIVDANLSPTLIICVTLAVMVVLGCFLDSFSILVITIPLVYPVIDAMGVDGVWFGILVVKAIEIGLITPPVGLNVFVVAGSMKGMTPEGVFRAVVPFIVAEFATIIVLMAVPDLVTWLPDLAFGPE